MTSLVTLLMLSLAPVQANDDISLGEPGYGGSGCPQGSASTILSPDGKSLSILFDEFMVEAVEKRERELHVKHVISPFLFTFHKDFLFPL